MKHFQNLKIIFQLIQILDFREFVLSFHIFPPLGYLITLICQKLSMNEE